MGGVQTPTMGVPIVQSIAVFIGRALYLPRSDNKMSARKYQSANSGDKMSARNESSFRGDYPSLTATNTVALDLYWFNHAVG